jgi:hypothetical protein
MDDTKNLLLEAILDLAREIKELRQELRPKAREEIDFPIPEPDIRSVYGKVNKEPKAGFEEILAWTTEQVNTAMSGLSNEDLKGIVESALTGKPIVEKDHKYHPDSTQGQMTDWLNANIPVINTQENVWDAIGKAKETARERIGILNKEAKEDWKRISKNQELAKALAAADVDTAKTETEIQQALRTPVIDKVPEDANARLC